MHLLDKKPLNLFDHCTYISKMYVKFIIRNNNIEVGSALSTSTRVLLFLIYIIKDEMFLLLTFFKVNNIIQPVNFSLYFNI